MEHGLRFMIQILGVELHEIVLGWGVVFVFSLSCVVFYCMVD